MTVSTEISSNEYTGNGVTTDFDYKFRIFKANQLSVITSDADGDNVVTLRLGTDYTVTGANKSAGGKVILTRPLADKRKISIARDIPIKQETSFRNQSKFFAETHEDAFDYLTMILQRIWGSLGSLYLKRPNILANWFDAKGYRIANLGKPKRDSDAVDLGTLKDEIEGVNSTILKKEKRTLRVDDMDIVALPKASDRAGNVLTFDKDGKPIVVAPATGSAVDVLNQLDKGDGSLIGIGGGRALSDKLNEVRSLLDFGGSDDGITDNTFAFERIINEMKNSGQRFDIYLPYANTGVYIYNGPQLNLPDGVSIIGENNWVTIDCSNNDNLNQHVIKLTGFRSRADRFVLKGNPNNKGLMGIHSEYNTELGGVQHVIFDDFEYGLDIDNTWYSDYSNLRFRSSSRTPYNGAHIRIGFYHPESEVNAIQFNNVYMSEQQKHSIAVYCRTQNISINGGSLETVGGARIKFYTNVQRNTFELNNVYIESHASGDDKVYLLEGVEGDNPSITCNNCMFRLGDNTAASEGSLAKNATVIINGGFSNSPRVYLNRNNTKVIFTTSRNLYFADNEFTKMKVKGERNIVGQLPSIGVDVLNTMAPVICNFISHTDTNFKPVFRVYIDSSAELKLINFELVSVVKSKLENYIQGFEKYNIIITTPTSSDSIASGTSVFKVASGVSGGANLLADLSFSVDFINTVDGKHIFVIKHKIGNSSRLGKCFIKMKGDFYKSGIFENPAYLEVEKI